MTYPTPHSQGLPGVQLSSPNTIMLPFLDTPCWDDLKLSSHPTCRLPGDMRALGLGWGVSQGLPLPDEPSRKVILQAFAEFERFTCVRFVAYRGQRDFISIIPMSG